MNGIPVVDDAAAQPGPPRRLPPVVVVAGRPNVGKSTLVNRIVGRRAAVVEERPGVTRDRLEFETEWAGVALSVVDTGGWLGGGRKADALDAKVSAQAEQGIAAADLVLLVVDAEVGVTTEDEEVARLLRRLRTPVLLVANKVDNEQREARAWELVSLGHGDPAMVSALHGRGVGDLLDEVVARVGPGSLPPGAPTRVEAAVVPPLPDAHDPAAATGGSGGSEPDAADREMRVAIVGRPNVGKSTLFNRLIGEERSVVHDLPGTTRDSVDTLIETDDGAIRFVDTAGMRRRSRTDPGTEYYATVRALGSLDRADAALLVVDATEGVTHQDQRLAERIGISGSPVLVVANKWELLDTEARHEVRDQVEDRLAFLGEAPLLPVSARTGLGVHKLLPALRASLEAYHRRIGTAELNREVRALQEAQPAPRARIRYAVQGAVDPPTITLFATGRLPATYLRYVERKLRERFALGATPIKIRVRLRG